MIFPTFARARVGYGPRFVDCGQMWSTRVAWQAMLILVFLSIPTVLAAQPPPHDWYEVRVERQSLIQIITFTTDDGPVRVVLPEHIVGGEWFYGTVELPSEGASTAPQSYVLQFAGQSAHANQRGFSWKAPEVAADTDVVLLVSDFRGVRVARVVSTVQARAPADETDGTLYIPKIVQSGHAMVVSGTFDGKGTNVSLSVGNTPSDLLAQTTRRSVFKVPPRLLGNTNYVFTQSGQAHTGTLRCVAIEKKGGATSLLNARSAPYQLVVRGLQGMDREVTIELRILTPTLATFGPVQVSPKDLSGEPAQIIYFQHFAETIYIQPSWLHKDGTFPINRVLNGIQPGRIRVDASLLIPASIEDEVALVLNMPRQNFSDLPGQAHANLLRRRYGDQAMPLLEAVLDRQPDFGEAVDAMLYLDMDAATPAIFRAISRKPNYNWDFALGWYMKKIGQEPNYRFRDGLHTAAAQIIESKPTDTAVQALVLTGSKADLPLLEHAYAIPNLHPIIRNMVEAALGRYGYDPALRAIEQKLSVVIGQTPPGQDFTWATQEAAFTHSPRLIPFLCRHLRDRSWDFGDYNVSPASDAAAALEEIRRANSTMSPEQLQCPSS
ncbi:MAG TPA: hypothetical protein VGR48_12850 [Terriglobales bacterium]|nr:hypothetical protein [Terriglobales bacterium]